MDIYIKYNRRVGLYIQVIKMDMKVIAIAIAAVVVVGGVAAVLIVNHNNGGSDDDAVKDRLLIYGNANNDDYLDDKDVEFIQDIIDKNKSWDRTANKFADTNHDGYISQEDITQLKKFINHENGGTMYYINACGDLASISYPLVKKIGCYHVYPLDACTILGLYDSVIGVTDNVFSLNMGQDTQKYPDLLTKCANLGLPKTDAEALLDSEVKTFLTYSYINMPQLTAAVENGDTDINVVQLNMSSRDPRGADRLGSILMLGVMFQTEDKAHEYVDWVDGVVDYIQQKAFQTTEYIAPLTSSTPTQAKLDCSFADGYMFGEIYTLSIIGFKDVYIPVDSSHACPFISYETIFNINPEFEFMILFNDFNDSRETTQALFEEKIKVYSETEAYKNHKAYGFNYYSMGTYYGFSQLALLCAFIYPDTYDMDKGWEYTQYYYDHFTNYKNVDVKTLGGAWVYELP